MGEQVHAIREAAYGEGFDAAVAANEEACGILRERIAMLEAAVATLRAALNCASEVARSAAGMTIEQLSAPTERYPDES